MHSAEDNKWANLGVSCSLKLLIIRDLLNELLLSTFVYTFQTCNSDFRTSSVIQNREIRLRGLDLDFIRITGFNFGKYYSKIKLKIR